MITQGFDNVYEALGIILSESGRLDLIEFFLSRGFISWSVRGTSMQLSKNNWPFVQMIIKKNFAFHPDDVISAAISRASNEVSAFIATSLLSLHSLRFSSPYSR